MFTVLVFSFAVLSTMRGRRKQMEIPAIHISPDTQPAIPVLAGAAQPADVVIRKRYNIPISDFMLNALLKKD